MAVFGKAQYIKRVEDDRLLTGTGGFTDNLSRPDQVACRSGALAACPRPDRSRSTPRPRARRRAWSPSSPGPTWRRRASATSSFPAMFPNADGSKPDMTPRRSLAHEVVRYVGEAVAAVVAESREQAQDAAELVEVEYDPLPSVSEIDDALKPGAPQVWKGAPGQPGRFQPLRRCRQGRRRLQAAAPIPCRSTSCTSA